MDEILEVLEKDARMSAEEISKCIKQDVKSIKKKIKKYEKDGVILGYKAIVNKEMVRSEHNSIRALIEVNVLPQKNQGFDHIAERIYKFKEVTNCSLLSGTYDLLLVVEGKDMQTISNFIAEKLSPMENVRRTTTHFLLKKYKENGVILKTKENNKRIAISY